MVHEDGKEGTAGTPGGASAQIVCWKLGSRLGVGLRYQRWREWFRAKSQRFVANDGDACRCRDLLEGVVVAILAPCFRVKTLDLCDLGGGGAFCVVTFLKALLWSFGFLSLVSLSGRLDAS